MIENHRVLAIVMELSNEDVLECLVTAEIHTFEYEIEIRLFNETA